MHVLCNLGGEARRLACERCTDTRAGERFLECALEVRAVEHLLDQALSFGLELGGDPVADVMFNRRPYNCLRERPSQCIVDEPADFGP